MIEVEHVSKIFPLKGKQKKEHKEIAPDGKLHAVSDVSFACKPGRVYALLGPNGAGKTTLLRMMSTLLKPSGGCIRVCGNDTTEVGDKVRREIGFLTGSTGLYDRFSIRETMHFFGRLNGMNAQEVEARIGILAPLLGLEKILHRRVGKMSTGMKQKASIARTILHDPQVVIFDEPTSGLDVLGARSIIDLVRRSRDEGKTVVFSTHRMDEVSLLADDLGIVHQGSLIFNGSLEAYEAQSGGVSLEEAFIQTLEAHS
jgi:sodium transport system ATP-binding protein